MTTYLPIDIDNLPVRDVVYKDSDTIQATLAATSVVTEISISTATFQLLSLDGTVVLLPPTAANIDIATGLTVAVSYLFNSVTWGVGDFLGIFTITLTTTQVANVALVIRVKGITAVASVSLNPILATAFPISQVKRLLVGLEPWLRRAAALPDTPFNDDSISGIIPLKVREFEQITQTRVMPVQCSTAQNLDGTYNNGNLSTSYDSGGTLMPLVLESPSAYYHDEAREFYRITLKERPIRVVQRLRIIAGSVDSSALLYEVPSDWIQYDIKSGRMWLIPVNTSALVGFAITFATLGLSFGNKGYIPQLNNVDYQAGLMDGWESAAEYFSLRQCINRMIAIEVLDNIAELFDAGKDNKTLSDGEGLSEQWSYTRFYKRKEELQSKVDRFIENDWIPQYCPIIFEVL